MSAATAFNVLALVLSTVSLLVSALLARRQAGTMRHANQLPVIVELTQEFKKPEFQAAENYVIGQLPEEHGPELGYSELPEPARTSVFYLTTLYISFGAIVALGIVDEVLIVSLYGYRVDRAWRVLEPYIQREREMRGGDPFARFFEDLVCRIRDNQPYVEAYGLTLRQLPTSHSQPN